MRRSSSGIGLWVLMRDGDGWGRDAREGGSGPSPSDTGLLGITWRLLSQGPCRTLPRVGWRPGSAPYLRPADVHRHLASYSSNQAGPSHHALHAPSGSNA